MLHGVYTGEGYPLPKLSYIVVTKKINPRFFLMGQTPQNPPPGTIVDKEVTFPERYGHLELPLFYDTEYIHSLVAGLIST